MPRMRSPAAARAARSSIAIAAVEPVPSPTTMPSATSATAASAATRFSRSFSAAARSGGMARRAARELAVDERAKTLGVIRRPHLYVIVEIDEDVAARELRPGTVNDTLGVGRLGAPSPGRDALGPLPQRILVIAAGI